jgi:Ankyrin repeats (many copies)
VPLDVLHFNASESLLTAPPKISGGENVLDRYIQCCRTLTNATYDTEESFFQYGVLISGNTYTEFLPPEDLCRFEESFEDHCEYMRKWCAFLSQQGAKAPGPLVGDDGFRISILHLKAAQAAIEGVYMNVLCGEDINIQTSAGETPLAFLLRSEDGKMGPQRFRERLRFLLNHGADPCTIDIQGMTPSHNAAMSGHIDEWAEALRDTGHDVLSVMRKSQQLQEQWMLKQTKGAVSTSVDHNPVFGAARRTPWASKPEE